MLFVKEIKYTCRCGNAYVVGPGQSEQETISAAIGRQKFCLQCGDAMERFIITGEINGGGEAI